MLSEIFQWGQGIEEQEALPQDDVVSSFQSRTGIVWYFFYLVNYCDGSNTSQY